MDLPRVIRLWSYMKQAEGNKEHQIRAHVSRVLEEVRAGARWASPEGGTARAKAQR